VQVKKQQKMFHVLRKTIFHILSLSPLEQVEIPPRDLSWPRVWNGCFVMVNIKSEIASLYWYSQF